MDKDKLIYENDIPDMPKQNNVNVEDLIARRVVIDDTIEMGVGSTVQYMEIRDPLPLKAVERYGFYNRWKPNGITNNIEEWARKSGGKHGND